MSVLSLQYINLHESIEYGRYGAASATFLQRLFRLSTAPNQHEKQIKDEDSLIYCKRFKTMDKLYEIIYLNKSQYHQSQNHFSAQISRSSVVLVNRLSEEFR